MRYGIFAILMFSVLHVYSLTFSDAQLNEITVFLKDEFPSLTVAPPLPLFGYQKNITLSVKDIFTQNNPAVSSYFVADEKTLLFFFNYEDHYETLKIKFLSPIDTLRDEGHERLISIGSYKPKMIFKYISYLDYLDKRQVELNDYFYRSIFPKLPHPAVSVKIQDVETQRISDDAIEFIEEYDAGFFKDFVIRVKTTADRKLK